MNTSLFQVVVQRVLNIAGLDVVKQVMIDGDVKVGSGDVWSVIPAKDGKTKWVTVKNK